MPRYFFHTQTESRMTDNEGTVLNGPIDARRKAIRTCGDMIQDSPEGFWGSRPWTVTVTNDVGLILWEVMMDGIASAATASLEPVPNPKN